MITLTVRTFGVRSRMRNLSLNATDRVTILYNVIVVIFTFIFRVKIAAYGYHLAFNLSVILLVLLLSLGRRSSLIKRDWHKRCSEHA